MAKKKPAARARATAKKGTRGAGARKPGMKDLEPRAARARMVVGGLRRMISDT
ncbi:MAG TPA: hypothetical protein VGD07_10355 [Methylomirabilota bacterium]